MLNDQSKNLSNTPALIKSGYWQTFGFQIGYKHEFNNFNLSIDFLKQRPKTFFGFDNELTFPYSSTGVEFHDVYSPSIGLGKSWDILNWLYLDATFSCHYTFIKLTGDEVFIDFGDYPKVKYKAIYSSNDSQQFRYELKIETGFKFLKRWNYHFNASYIMGNKKYINAQLKYSILSGENEGEYNNEISSNGTAWTLGMGIGFDIVKK